MVYHCMSSLDSQHALRTPANLAENKSVCFQTLINLQIVSVKKNEHR